MQKFNLGFDLELLTNYSVLGSVVSHNYLIFFDATAFDYNHIVPQAVCIGKDIYVNSGSWLSLLKKLVKKLFNLRIVSIDDFFEFRSKNSGEIIFNSIPLDCDSIKIRDNIYLIKKLNNDEYVQLFSDIATEFGDFNNSFLIAKIPTKYENEEVVNHISSNVIDIFYSYYIEEEKLSIRVVNKYVDDILLINECLKENNFNYYNLFAGCFMGKKIQKNMYKIVNAVARYLGDDMFVEVAKSRLEELINFYNYLTNNSSSINNGKIKSIII